MDRFSRLLGKFSAEKAANLRNTMNKSLSYGNQCQWNQRLQNQIWENRGKVLKHLKTDKNQLFLY